MSSQLPYRLILDGAVEAMGGQVRSGQVQMADAVADSLAAGKHLLVQAGTGTGKSLGYLAPAIAAVENGERIVVATATLALQHQLATNDIPLALAAAKKTLGREVHAEVLKGRANYACLLKVNEGSVSQDSLLGAEELASEAASYDSTTALGTLVLALRQWAKEEADQKGVGDRDDAPTHTGLAWSQVSATSSECIGAQRCPYGDECFAERSRERARSCELIVTNHALLAVDAMIGGGSLPEHSAVIIDEAHELVSRVTAAATDELSVPMIERVGRRVTPFLSDETVLDFIESADGLADALAATDPGRIEASNMTVIDALTLVRDAARAVVSGMSGESDTEKMQASQAAKGVFDVANRLASCAQQDVIWLNRNERGEDSLAVAPLDVASLMHNTVFAHKSVVMTSATLNLGGSFDPVARSVGLAFGDDDAWVGIDVGSPFDYPKQGICYIARALPPPGRDGISEQTLAQLAELVWAADGHTLGLFASRKAAETAARYVANELKHLTILCQGDAQLSELKTRFTQEPQTSLFGTMSLWQGVDVPGDTCRLVVIDKIPFPRPDDPLMQARQRAVEKGGGNGFMSIAATHAALLLAQGAGRLIRRFDDRGLVAVLDPRLVTARYGSFLRASMPDFWQTEDAEVALAALRRLSGKDA